MTVSRLGVAAELALGALTGRERAQAITHLDKCRACRKQVQHMTLTGTQLLMLLPEHQPPAGFAARVTRRLPSTRRHRRPRRSQRMFTVVAGTIIAVTCGLAGFGLRTMPAPPRDPSSMAPPALRSASLTTARHQVIGTVFLYGGSQPWLYMTVKTGTGNSTVICQMHERDGHLITVGSFHLAGGHGSWGSPEPDQAAAITSARLTSTGGFVLATGSFSPPG